MVQHDEVTLDQSMTMNLTPDPETPGVLVVFSGESPTCVAAPLVNGRLRIGRVGGQGVDLALDDPHLSRAHVEIARADGVWQVRDLGSRNGTAVDGQALAGPCTARDVRAIAVGRTILACVADVRPHLRGGVEVSGGRVFGPTLREAIDRLGRIAAQGDGALIIGESGSGKELAAELFHARSGRSGPLVAVNCAAIPEGMAERLFFGARKGAYSGAVENATGYLQAAHGGVLFLDELGEIDLAVQAKLLRVLERREVVPLGCVQPVPVDVLVCAATHCDIRGAVAAGRFRADLFYRIGQREVRIPPLRERPEEIAFLACQVLAGVDRRLRAHPSFIEACLLNPWLGNIRELRSAVREAADRTLTEEKVDVRGEHLPRLGLPLGTPAGVAGMAGARGLVTTPESGTPAPRRPLTREEIEAALELNHGNVARTARALALHRTQLYRLMDSFGLRRPD